MTKSLGLKKFNFELIINSFFDFKPLIIHFEAPKIWRPRQPPLSPRPYCGPVYRRSYIMSDSALQRNKSLKKCKKYHAMCELALIVLRYIFISVVNFINILQSLFRNKSALHSLGAIQIIRDTLRGGGRDSVTK